MAEKCGGWITIEGSHSQTVWANQTVSCNIPVGLPMDLRLFELKTRKLIFRQSVKKLIPNNC